LPEPAPESSHQQDFRRAILQRYLRAYLVPSALIALGIGMVLNVVYRYVAFNWLSEKFRIYESMTAVVFFLSIDLYLLVLYSVSSGVFRRYSDNGIFRDLYVSGLRSWQIFSPLIEVLSLLVFADALVEGVIASLTTHEPGRVPIIGFIATMVFSVIVSVFIACCYTVLHLRQTSKAVGYGFVFAISYATAAALAALADVFEPVIAGWRSAEDLPFFARMLNSVSGSSSQLFSSLFAGYIAQSIIGLVLLALLPPLYMYTRRLAESRYARIAGS
jgi:hypothetical protein